MSRPDSRPAARHSAPPPGGDPAAALRPLPHPRPVLVNPARMWIPPRVPSPRPTIGVQAQSFATSPSGAWLPARQFAWARLHVGDFAWYAEVEVLLTTRNGRCTTPFRQWVPADAVRLPEA